MTSEFRHLLRRISRRRPASSEDDVQTKGHKDGFKQCLSTLDLVSLGVGSCCGTGMYLTAGLVTQENAGPGAVVSFVVAGLGSLLSGICYAELAARCPRTSGSAYMYSYVTVGELVAYIIGWGLIVEYAIGTAAGAVALSATIDSMTNFTFSKLMTSYIGPLGGRPYFDAVSVLICVILTLVLTSGVELSATVNNILNAVNAGVLIIFLATSAWFAQTTNWTNYGFFPFGLKGVIKAIPTSYFAFIGFDIVATTGEEAKDPSKAIPRSIWLSVIINTIVYTSVVLCLTLVVPFFNLHKNTAMVDLFAQRRVPLFKYIIAGGATCGLFAATFGSMFPLPRVLYAMAKDGLIFSQFGNICPSRKTPKMATIISGSVAAVLSATVDLSMLIELVLIGTLMAYVLVAFSVLLLRYAPPKENGTDIADVIGVSPGQKVDSMEDLSGREDIPSGPTENQNSRIRHETEFSEYREESEGSPRQQNASKLIKFRSFLLPVSRIFSDKNEKSEKQIIILLLTILLNQTFLSLIFTVFGNYIIEGHTVTVLMAVVFLSLFLLQVGFLSRLPQSVCKQSFHAPCVPVLPLMVSFFNIYLMTSLGASTWCLFAFWMALGFILYFMYGIKNSRQESASETTTRIPEDRMSLLQITDVE